MRPAEFTDEQIIQAGQALEAKGTNVTGFALRKAIGGGTPARLVQVWNAFKDQAGGELMEAVPELPIELEELVGQLQRGMADSIKQVALTIHDRATKGAEKRVSDVVRLSNEQQEQAKREIADASSAVEELENEVDGLRDELQGKAEELAAAHAAAQEAAIKSAQQAERLDAATAEVAELRRQLDACSQERDAAKREGENARADVKVAQARAQEIEQAKRDAAAAHAERIKDLETSLADARKTIASKDQQIADANEQAAQAREQTARLSGQIEAIRAEQEKAKAEVPAEPAGSPAAQKTAQKKPAVKAGQGDKSK